MQPEGRGISAYAARLRGWVALVAKQPFPIPSPGQLQQLAGASQTNTGVEDPSRRIRVARCARALSRDHRLYLSRLFGCGLSMGL